ncbi:MAG TPA: hypothetical protein VEX38_04140, partial [Fimbriimonadaceae bacterium]|nr:hypothetical protein [Fimbriimonadaceae bacterium]
MDSLFFTFGLPKSSEGQLAGISRVMLSSAIALLLLQGSPISVSNRSVSVDGRKISAQVVQVDLSRVRMKLGLAENRVGRTEELGSIAKRQGALAAINGSFFEAYTSNPIKSPNHTLISEGRFVHVGTVGTTLAFDTDGRGRIERRIWTISGSRDGKNTWPGRWFA